MNTDKLMALLDANFPDGLEWRSSNITQVGVNLSDPLEATGYFHATGRQDEAEPRSAAIVAAINYLRSDEFRRVREDAAVARLGHELFAKQLIRADQSDKVVQELAMIVRGLCYALSKRSPDHSALKQARDYLASHGLQGSLLRNDAAIDAART